MKCTKNWALSEWWLLASSQVEFSTILKGMLYNVHVGTAGFAQFKLYFNKKRPQVPTIQ